MFSALRQGGTVYVLEKGEKPILKFGRVTSATSPYSYLNNGSVDISVKSDEENLEFKQLPSQLSIATYGNTIISETKELLSSEVENMIRESKQILDSIPHHEAVVIEGEEILKKLNPQFAKQKDQEDKINNLETKVGSMESKLDDISSMLKQALKQ